MLLALSSGLCIVQGPAPRPLELFVCVRDFAAQKPRRESKGLWRGEQRTLYDTREGLFYVEGRVWPSAFGNSFRPRAEAAPSRVPAPSTRFPGRAPGVTPLWALSLIHI